MHPPRTALCTQTGKSCTLEHVVPAVVPEALAAHMDWAWQQLQQLCPRSVALLWWTPGGRRLVDAWVYERCPSDAEAFLCDFVRLKVIMDEVRGLGCNVLGHSKPWNRAAGAILDADVIQALPGALGQPLYGVNEAMAATLRHPPRALTRQSPADLKRASVYLYVYESVDRLAALITLAGITGLDELAGEAAEQYLTEMYDMLLTCHVPAALGELAALACSALETYRRRSVELRPSLDVYVRDGGPNPARAAMDGLLCQHKLGGHAQALLESICQLLLSCVFDPIWRHRDLLAQEPVRALVVALSNSELLPACSELCVRLRPMLARPASPEAASHTWLLGFVARCFTVFVASVLPVDPDELPLMLSLMAASGDAELAPFPAIHAAHSAAVALHRVLQTDFAAGGGATGGSPLPGSGNTPNGPNGHVARYSPNGTNGSNGPNGSNGSHGYFWPLAPTPPPHTALLLDCFVSSLLSYAAFLHPDPDKDPITLRAVERCHEQLLDMCGATGQGLRLGVSAVVHATRGGLLPALEAVMRAAGLTGRLEALRVLLGSVLGSAPALQQLLITRDAALFLTLRKLVPPPALGPPTSRYSLSLVHEGRVAAAAGIKIDAAGNALPGPGEYGADGAYSEAELEARRRRSFEREATELLPLAQLLPFALSWLASPASDLADALAQEVINDDGSGSLYGDYAAGLGTEAVGSGAVGAVGGGCTAGRDAKDGDGEGSLLVSEYGSAADKSLRLRTCSNPCCMNLSGLHESQLRLAPCPRCGGEWYCSRHCQTMHWHSGGHKAKCGK
eukprot:XP_001702272.1 predicted protein [Chlamydomonas reinhardtii]